MEFLSERKINNDLKRNFPGEGIRIYHLFKPGNPFFAQSKEEVIVGYTCGYKLREFLLNQKFRLTFSARELIPIVYNVYGVKEIYDICGAGKGPKGIEDLKDLGILNYKRINGRRVVFYIHNFDTMKSNLKEYAYKNSFPYRKFCEKFEESLGSLRPYINQISERSVEVYNAAIEWYGRYKDLKGFTFVPKTLTIVGIENFLIA
ncbi:MAG: hypothetical protein QXQ69_02965 [Candidatus Aenigmatarchaeota archaeon]